MAPDPALRFDLPSGPVTVTRSALKPVGRGGISSVYGYSRGGEQYAVKLFNRPERAPWDKITLLTQTAGAAPNPQYVIGWPTAIVTAEGGRAGIVLPLFPTEFWCPLDHWVEFHLAAKLPANSGLITARIHILNNCAAALADLHERGCAVVDLKPSNILVNRATFQVAFIDVDSYRVERNGTVYPATHISPGYILPRAIGETIDVAGLGREQDRYAFAVIVFQMLNFGTHPYQGVLTGPTEGADTNDEKAKRRLYAYGAVPSMMIRPLKQSVHLCWPVPLRDRLEAALTREDAVPSAKDWADYFGGVLQSKQFERCTVKPDDVRHIRFLGLPCMACAREAVIPRSKAPKLPPLPPGGAPPIVPPPLPPAGNSVWKMVGGIAAAVVGLAVLAGRLAPMLQQHPYRPAQPIGFLPAPPPASIMFKRVIAWTRLDMAGKSDFVAAGEFVPGAGLALGPHWVDPDGWDWVTATGAGLTGKTIQGLVREDFLIGSGLTAQSSQRCAVAPAGGTPLYSRIAAEVVRQVDDARDDLILGRTPAGQRFRVDTSFRSGTGWEWHVVTLNNGGTAVVRADELLPAHRTSVGADGSVTCG